MIYAHRGLVSASAAAPQALAVNSAGVTTFGSTVGASTPIAGLTTDAVGTSSFGGDITVGAAVGTTTSTTTPKIVIGDQASGAANLKITDTSGGLISVNNATATFPAVINTAGSVVVTGATALGTTAAPLVLTTTPTNLKVDNPIGLVFNSPAIPAALIFAPNASVQNFVAGSGSSVVLAANASQLTATASVSSVQSSAAAAVAEASKAGFDTDSVAQQINYGFAGDVGVSPPMDHRIDATGVSVPKGFGEEDDDVDEPPKK